MGKSILLFVLLVSQTCIAQPKVTDTFVKAGTFSLHFQILPGSGLPILFESGGGNDGSVWRNFAVAVAQVTNAPVIMYDRPGIGKSGIDSNSMSIVNDVTSLESGLEQLGYSKGIFLVSHSLGGFYNSVFAARNPSRVKAMVFIDVNHPQFFTTQHLDNMKASSRFRDMVRSVREHAVPMSIPVTDIVSGKTLFAGTPDADRWKEAHARFVDESPKRKGIIAEESGHYIFLQNKQLVLAAIVSSYVDAIPQNAKEEILHRYLAYTQNAANEDHKQNVAYNHSENDLNEWGYALLSTGETDHAVEVFKLNTILHPRSANAFDSLGEAYKKSGKKEMAVRCYRKCLELNPASKNAKRMLEELEK